MEWNLKDRKELTKINIRQTDRQNRRNMMHVCTLSYWLDEPHLHYSNLYVCLCLCLCVSISVWLLARWAMPSRLQPTCVPVSVCVCVCVCVSVSLYRTLSYWLDEPRLHDSSLYVPALPAEYQAQLLVTVFQSQTVSITVQSLVTAPCRLWVRRWGRRMLDGHAGSAVKVLVAIPYSVVVARNGYIRNVVV